MCGYDADSCGGDSIDPSGLYSALKNGNEGLIAAFSNAMTEDFATKGHSERVVEYALSIGHEIGLKEEVLDCLKVAGMVTVRTVSSRGAQKVSANTTSVAGTAAVG